jgi:hypothetical protein
LYHLPKIRYAAARKIKPRIHPVNYRLELIVSLAQPSPKQSSRSISLPPGTKELKELEYGMGSGRAMRLDLYLPEKGDKPLPLIIWIHGGAWMAGSKDAPSPALRFTTKGYAVAQVGYRLSQGYRPRLAGAGLHRLQHRQPGVRPDTHRGICEHGALPEGEVGRFLGIGGFASGTGVLQSLHASSPA